MRNRVTVVLLMCFVLTALAVACGPAEKSSEHGAQEDRQADEAAIRNRDMEWSNAFEMKDLDKVISIYAEDAIALFPNAPRVVGREAAREINGKQLAVLSGKWRPDKVVVARSGDIGYSVGTYDVTMNDPKADPPGDSGNYIVIWRKRTDGTWEVAVEGFNSETPSKSTAY